MITEEHIHAFRRDGAVCVRSAVSVEWLAQLRSASDRVLRTPPWLVATDGVALPDTFLWIYEKTFDDFLRSPGIAAVAGNLMESTSTRLFYDQVLAKTPGQQTRTHWHQDLPYWPLVGSQLCSIWLALDHVNSENGGLEYVAGSHTWNKVFRPPLEDGDTFFDDTGFEIPPDVDQCRSQYEILSWALEPGDCVVHHALTLHASFPNNSEQPRRGYITRWIGDDVTFDPRPKTMAFPVKVDLPKHAKPAIRLFPRLWTRRVLASDQTTVPVPGNESTIHAR
jgi:ectoine hydroxylase-related dioxygenase (phytanoyl-CoA dioxygenase family)